MCRPIFLKGNAMKRVILSLTAGLLLLVLAGVMLVSAPFLGQMRAHLVQSQLDKAGGGVTISGPVSVRLGKVLHVRAEDITLDSPGGGIHVAKAEADLFLSDLLHRRIAPTNTVITGASAALVRDEQGKLAGETAEGTAHKTGIAATPDPASVLAALAGQTIRLVDTRVRVEDRRSNFVFDAQLPTLVLQGDAEPGSATLQGKGTLNDQPLELAASISKGGHLAATLKIGATVTSFKGAGGGLSGEISIESADLSQTLKILQLQPTLDGTASARAILTETADGDLSVTGIAATATLDSGQTARASGSIGNLRRMDEADIAIDIGLYPRGKEPPSARLIKDLRLMSVHLSLAGPLRGDTRRRMTIATNGFQINTADVGPAPVKVSGISRGPAGELVIGHISAEIGPVDAPWLTVDGRVGDVLNLSGLSMDGRVDFPMSAIVGADARKLPDDLGSIAGQVKVSGSIDGLALTDIGLATRDTALWSLQIAGSVASVLPIDGVKLTMDASFQTAAMLSALGKEPIDLAPLDLHLTAASTETEGTVAGKLSMRMAKSEVIVDLSANNRGPGPVVKGSVTSPLIRLQDLSDGLRAVSEIFDDILGKAPGVANAKQSVSQNAVQNITIGLFDKNRLLRYGDVDIAIRFAEIAGTSAFKGIEANLVVGHGKASVGPLKFSFDGGHFDLLASIDTITAPSIVRLKGASKGLDLGEIMKVMRVKIPATGTIDAEFDISGNHDSVARFVDTLDGSTTLRMRNGTVATSLLDLAGLGIVPWLFSKDRREKEATITCLRAPLTFRNGVVTTQDTVVETPDVQLVAYGTVNIPRRTLDVAGQPRPVGKPLSRSPWPFTLSGALTAPKVKVKTGPARLRRADGANKMPAKRVPCVPDILQLK
jgi:uncharacterized protein involved in outer membrane biogenesis